MNQKWANAGPSVSEKNNNNKTTQPEILENEGEENARQTDSVSEPHKNIPEW